MSQKKIKLLKKIDKVKEFREENFKELKGVREILIENWRFLLLLLAFTFMLFTNALNGDFVSDDYASITDNSNVTSFSVMGKGLLPSISNWAIASLFGTEKSLPYHLFNILLYLIILVEVFIVIYLIYDKSVAILSSILFSVLPIHVEAISWISGKPYPISAFFILLTFILILYYLHSGNKRFFYWTILMLPVVFIADRIRSPALVLITFLYLLAFRDRIKVKINWSKIVGVSLALFALIVVVVWPMIIDRITSVNSGYNGYGGNFYNPFFQYPTAIAKYLQLLLVPIDLTLYQTMFNIPVWLNWAIILTYITAVVYFFFKDKKIFFALAFIFAATAPSMAPVKVSWLVAERYMFLGSIGFCLFLVLFFQRFQKRFEVLLLILFTLLTITYAYRTYLRNIDWQTNHKLWVNTCQVSPNSHNAWNNIGDDYDKLAQLEETDEGKWRQYENAVKGFTQSVTVKPNYADAYHNRANIFYKMGRYDLARDSYKTALSYGPSLYQSYYSLVQIDLLLKDYQSALDNLSKLDKVKPNDPQVYYAAAVVYAYMGDFNQASQILEQLVAANPGWKEAGDLLSQIKNGTWMERK